MKSHEEEPDGSFLFLTDEGLLDVVIVQSDECFDAQFGLTIGHVFASFHQFIDGGVSHT